MQRTRKGQKKTKPASPDRRALFAMRSRVCLAAFASSVLMLLAFPPISFWGLAFCIPVPMIWAAGVVNRNAADSGHAHRFGAALAATLGVMGFWMWEQQWVFAVSLVGGLLLVIYLSMYAGAFVWLCSWIGARLRVSVWLVGPIVWAGLEFARGDVLWHGYPWMLAGHPIIAWPFLAHAGAVIGAYGVSFLTVALGSALGCAVLSRGSRRWAGAAVVVVIAGVWLGLSLVPGVQTEGSMRVAVVQSNVAQSVKMGWSPPERLADLDTLLALTERASRANPKPDVIVWPETMFPGDALEPDALNEERAARLIWYTDRDTEWPELAFVVWRGPDGIDQPERITGPFERGDSLAVWTTVAADSVLAWQQRLGIPMLIGAVAIDDLSITVDPVDGTVDTTFSKLYNSSYLIKDGKAAWTRYDKIHLTPFGEVMPYISSWKWLEQLFLQIGIGARGMSFDLSAGTKPIVHVVQTQDAGLVRVATPICFEGVMPGLCRRLAYAGSDRRADILVQMTNEGWFGTFDSGREQHLEAVRWRAVELGVSVVRAANTGISALIGPSGRVLREGVEGGKTSRVPGVLWAEAPLTRGGTLYGRWGDIVGLVVFVLGMFLIGAAAIVGTRQRRAARTAEKENG